MYSFLAHAGSMLKKARGGRGGDQLRARAATQTLPSEHFADDGTLQSGSAAFAHLPAAHARDAITHAPLPRLRQADPGGAKYTVVVPSQAAWRELLRTVARANITIGAPPPGMPAQQPWGAVPQAPACCCQAQLSPCPLPRRR